MPILGAVLMLLGFLFGWLASQIVRAAQDEFMCRNLYESYRVLCRDKLNTEESFEDFMRDMKRTFYTLVVLAPASVGFGWFILLSNI